MSVVSDFVIRMLVADIFNFLTKFLIGNEMRHNSTLMQRSMASLEWLRTGDRITLELTNTRSLKVLLNSEDMNITFPNVGTVSAGQ